MKPKEEQTLALEPVRPQTETALARPAPSPAEMMQAMIDKGVTHENVAAFKELVILSEHMEDRRSSRDFIKDFVAMQSEMKQVKATKDVHAKDGSLKYRVATPEEIDDQARPIYQSHGFAVSFKEGDSTPGRIREICILQHISGHREEYPYSVRVGSGPPGATESQADGSAHSYAKRGALCGALNIVIDHADDDPRNEGAPITKEQAEELQRRVIETESNEMAFLKLAGVTGIAGKPTLKEYQCIMSDKYQMLDEMLRKKESRGR